MSILNKEDLTVEYVHTGRGRVIDNPAGVLIKHKSGIQVQSTVHNKRIQNMAEAMKDIEQKVKEDIVEKVRAEMHKRSAKTPHYYDCPYNRGDYCECIVYIWTSHLEEIVMITMNKIFNQEVI